MTKILIWLVLMAFNQTNFPHFPSCLGPCCAQASFSNKVLDSSDGDYVFRVSGDAFGILFSAPYADTVTDVYLHVNTAPTGSPNLVGGFYNSTTSTPSPSLPLVGNTAVATNIAADQWMRFTNLNALLTPGKRYWFLVGSTNASTTSVQIQTSSPLVISPGIGEYDDWSDRTSSDGGATISSGVATTKSLAVFKFQNNGVYGSPYTTAEAHTNNALERGNLITGLTNDIEVVGAVWAHTTTCPATAFKIYDTDDGPGTSTILDLTLDAAGFTSAAKLLDFRFPPVLLEAGGTYVYSFVFGGGNSVLPGKFTIADSARYTDVANCALGGPTNFYSVISNAGATAWEADATKICRMGLLIQPNRTLSASVPEVADTTKELFVDINVKYADDTDGDRTYEVNKGGLEFDAGDLYLDGIQTIGTSVEAITIGDIATPGFVFLKNLDSTGTVTIRNGSGGADVVKLAPGDIAFFRLAATTPYAIATTNACDLHVVIYEA